MKLIQVTDPHLRKPGETLFGIDPAERLALCFADINAQHANADLCVITGDLTCGDEAAYALLRDLLSELATPWQLLLGNHDNRDSFLRIFPDAKIDANGFAQHAQEIDGFMLLFLDTLEPGTHAGGYCERRQEWLSRELAASGDRPVYIFMHHPPLRVGIPSLDAICLMQRDKFKETLASHKQRIRHIFFGHLHRPVSGTWDGIPFSGLRGTAHQCWLDFEARDQPSGSHEPPAYGIILANETSTIIHLHDFLNKGTRFPF
jgi:3',5'-cyclic-AMP phosphodiesterase